MKKRLMLLSLLACLCALSGCAKQPAPVAALDGAAWDESWTVLDNTLGVEQPQNGFTLLANNQALAIENIHLATWASGDPIPYITAEGEETNIYEAQIYLLLTSYKDEATAKANVQDWIARESGTYTVAKTLSETHNGQDYTLLVYDCGSDTNPYARGASAFATFGKYAITAELTCLDAYMGDAQALLSAFLGGCHYSAAANR